ncbi:VPLPA-CTERM sorting domain-containing protein [Nitrincola sp.]|uniref:VPLPA-CTERM sorting domain-containing protein n=1 Tax=Nitrincola sp. TaxID=1926584 RepID=UPI003A9018AA
MRTLLLAALLLCVSPLTQAATIHFNASGSSLFTLNPSYYMDNNRANSLTNSGYDSVATTTGGPYIAYNGNEAPLVTFDWNDTGTFDLNSFVIASAWGSQTLTINGYTDAVLTYTAQLFVDTAARVFQADWFGLTSFSIATGTDFEQYSNVGGSGQHWAMNALTFNENLSETPLPAAAWMFLAGIAGVLSIRRKAARKAIG